MNLNAGGPLMAMLLIHPWRVFPLLLLVFNVPLAAEDSAHPPGPHESIVSSVAASGTPALPPGLETSGDTPALPPGLGDSVSSPSLPPGLGGESESPSLPPGLGGGSGSTPALPPGLGTGSEPAGQEQDNNTLKLFEPHGFIELRGGLRLRDDPAQGKTATIGETRLQLRLDKDWSGAVFEFTGDAVLDGVLEKADFDLRQARVTIPIGDHLDLRAGRQVLTWGTGDMLFINDLFPKDWQSFFIGRDVAYLKAPSDAIKIGFFSDPVNLEVVYTPQFSPDRYIKGELISYWNPLRGAHSGSTDQVNANPPSDWFSDDEWAVRAYRRFGGFETALYGYWGYWKSPGGQSIIPLRATFPRLNVYGASVRGPLGRGIVNAEVGYYDSRDDRKGDSFLVNNSEFRLLLGYERELGTKFTGAFQYYLEHMMDYGDYTDTRPFFQPKRDENRHVLTARFTKLLMEERLMLSLFAYYSPSDQDAYLRPRISYTINDHLQAEVGGNIFWGTSDTSFFGQFSHNNNLYTAIRFSF